MALTDRQRRFAKKIKNVFDEGRIFCADDAIGISIFLQTDEEMDLMERFLDEHPQAEHDEILMRMLEIYEQYHDD